MIFHLLGVPSGAHAEKKPPLANHIERGGLLGQYYGIVLGDQADPGAENNAPRDGSRCSDHDEWIVQFGIVLGQFTAEWKPCLSAGRYVCVFWIGRRVKSPLFRRLDHVNRIHRIRSWIKMHSE